MNTTDWSLCFICQVHKNENLRSTKQCLETLARNLPQFDAIGSLGFSYDRISSNNSSLLSILTNNNAQYHNICSSKYSDSKLQRLTASHQKRKAAAATNNECEAPRKTTRQSSESATVSKLYCCWCNKNDNNSNLVAAGTYWASRTKTKIEHVKNLTEKWRHIAVTLHHEHVMQTLASGDVASNEMYYHKNCLTEITNKYRSVVNPKQELNDDAWIKELSLNKIIFHLKDTEMSNPGHVFPVCELEKMYINLLAAHHVSWSTHTTRFTELITSRIPALMKTTIGNKVSVFFDSAVTQTIYPEDTRPESFFESLVQVIEPVRKAMYRKCETTQSGKVDKSAQIASVPIELLTLVNFLQDGIDLSDKGFSKESLAISQTIMHNFRYNRDKKELSSHKRHDRSKETPFPLYVAVKLYSVSRSKTLINWLYYSAGISISYGRLLDVTRDLANRMISQYEKDGVFLPRILRKDILTIIAKDNIDHNAKSSTAAKHYHGTSLSVFQFPTISNPGIPLELLENTITSNTKKIEELPSSYTCIKHFIIPIKKLFPNSGEIVLCQYNEQIYLEGFREELQWLEDAHDADNSWVPWAQHHSSKQRSEVRPRDISAILPLIDDPVNTLDMQYHCMNIVQDTIKILNPKQISVDVCDQPIFALTKELQWRYPEKFGFNKYFYIIGPLHIEKSILIMIGEMIKGSGLAQELASCELSILGTESLVTVNHIKRARYCLQRAICVIYSFLVSAHQESGDHRNLLEWLDQRRNNSEMCFYWKTILDMMINVLVLIRSIREGRFLLYCSSLRKIVGWYYSLDHYNYARWITVHLYDLMLLPEKSPHLSEYFLKGYFAFQKSDNEFSLMGLDQAHEQNNAVIKVIGGATHSLNKEYESALARWELCLHELSLIISEYEEDNDSPEWKPLPHHEDNQTFKERFSKDVTHLQEATVTNPFKLDKLTVLNHEDTSFNASVFEDIRILSSKGEEQFRDFWEKRLVSRTLSIKDAISLNSYNVPGNQSKNAEKDPVMTSAMRAKLKGAANIRKELVEEALDNEVFGICQSLAKDQHSLYDGTKSHVMKCFNSSSEPTISSDKSGIVIELSMLLRKTLETWVKTFDDYATFLFREIMKLAEKFSRCDVVADQYFPGSLKEGLRADRGSGIVITFGDNSNLPSNFESKFLKCSSCIIGCTSEEADARIIRHAINLGKRGESDVNLRTLVPSPSGILQHVKRASIQAGYLWKLCEFDISIPLPEKWGWRSNEDTYIPRWQEEETFDIASIIKTCSCTKGDCSTCSCEKDMKFLTYCKCERDKCKNGLS